MKIRRNSLTFFWLHRHSIPTTLDRVLAGKCGWAGRDEFFLFLSVPIKKVVFSKKNSSFHCLYLPDPPWQMTLVVPYRTVELNINILKIGSRYRRKMECAETWELWCQEFALFFSYPLAALPFSWNDWQCNSAEGSLTNPIVGCLNKKRTCPNVQEDAFWPRWKSICDCFPYNTHETVLDDRAGKVQSPSWHVQSKFFEKKMEKNRKISRKKSKNFQQKNEKSKISPPKKNRGKKYNFFWKKEATVPRWLPTEEKRLIQRRKKIKFNLKIYNQFKSIHQVQ